MHIYIGKETGPKEPADRRRTGGRDLEKKNGGSDRERKAILKDKYDTYSEISIRRQQKRQRKRSKGFK
jgi:hypothetical protein